MFKHGFKPGDKVKCIDDRNRILEIGRLYTITSIDSVYMYLMDSSRMTPFRIGIGDLKLDLELLKIEEMEKTESSLSPRKGRRIEVDESFIDVGMGIVNNKRTNELADFLRESLKASESTKVEITKKFKYRR